MSVMAVNNSSSAAAVVVPPLAPAPSGPASLRTSTPAGSRPATPNMPLATKSLSSIPFSRTMSTVEYKHLRFIILDCPTEANLPLYKDEFKVRNVTDVVRVCERTYNKALFEENGIKVHDWPFKDGGVPPSNIVNSFLALCDEKFGGILGHKQLNSGIASGTESSLEEGMSPAIAVHCVAGLGRAPILVAICLVEAGMEPLDAVEFIRRRRRGALNSVQLQWLVDTYKRCWHKQSRLGVGTSAGATSGSSMNKYVFLKRTGSPTGTQSTPPNGVAVTASDDAGNPMGNHGGSSEGLKEKVGKIFRFKKVGSQASNEGAASSITATPGSTVEKTTQPVPGSSIAV